MTLADHPGWAVLLAGVIVAVALSVAGVALVARGAFALKRRVEAYRTLPVFDVVALTQARIALAERRIAEAPILLARARRAVADIDAARHRLRLIAKTVIGVASNPFALLLSLVSAPRATGKRIPGS